MMEMRWHPATVPGVPRRVRWYAYAATLTVLPSGIWRLLAVYGHVPLVDHPADPGAGHGPILITGWWYVLALTVVSEALAYLTVGLIAPWGETVPRWVPGLGGRRIPVAAVTIPAALGATFLTLLWPYALVMIALGRTVQGEVAGVDPHGWQAVAFDVAYWPLAAWGPLLGLVTLHYHRRRTTAGC
jgi:hypothetical protein